MSADGVARADRHRPRPVLVLLTVAVLVASVLSLVTQATQAVAASSPCGATVNAVVCENSQTRNVDGSALVDEDTWDIDKAGDKSIQGYSSDISVDAGNPLNLKIDTTHPYRIDIYRLGFYGGAGARKWVANLSHANPVAQPSCLTDPSTQLVDCGNWSVSATWNVPSAAVSGVYFARLTRTDSANDASSMITFIVRNDASTSDVVFQTSDPTWQAYNTYGGNDFYVGDQQLSNSQARAFKISYNRPFATRDNSSGADFLFSNEYPTIRLLERNGYDVSYISGVDTDRFGATLLGKHKVFMSVGHDEYWSQQQRTNIENARDGGVNLMFLAGNEGYWRTRYEPSIDGSNTAYRTLVCYKQTWDAAATDPVGGTTSTFRDPRFNDTVPENALTGTAYMANFDDLPVTVSQAEGRTRLWRGTALPSMTASSTALAPHTVGYESDEDLDNGFRPAGLVDLSTTVGSTPQRLQDFGLVVAPGTTTHHVTLYRAASGALVFGAGTIQWGWGLDAQHDGNFDNTPADSRMQQATLNMLADMQALPTTLMSGLTNPLPSTDTRAPTVTITGPADNAAIAHGTRVTVTGTATDTGGVVAGVEVSVDGGDSWHPATGKTSWSYSGQLTGSGTVRSIRVRASDDSANVSSPQSLSTTVSCPCSLFGEAVPDQTDGGDPSAVEVGVKVVPDTDGYISGVRFYKAAANTGTHFGTLWTAGGQQLASGTFGNETSAGWQTLRFASPVAVTAGTTYVASYWAPKGHYSATSNFFYYKPFRASPLSAPNTRPGGSQVNGVFGTSRGFPSRSFNAANYWVDVEFNPSSAVPPSVTARTPSPNSSSAPVTSRPTVTFSKPMTPGTVSFALRRSGSSTDVAANVAYEATTKTATLTPAADLDAGTVYTATVTGSDTNGNALPAPVTWTFRTAYAGQTGDECPCSLFADTTVPSIATVDDSASVELGIRFTADTDGVVTGVRFYKGPQNTGVHTGSLWTTGGTQLATATFSDESSSGWQTVTFADPVPVTAGTSYVASYRAPSGYYSATVGAYSSTGIDNFPLHAPVRGAVYTYGSGAPLTGSDADYGVDVVFTVPNSVVPTVTASAPSDGDTNVPTSRPVTARFNTSLLSPPTVQLVTSGGATVAGNTVLNANRTALTFTPAAALAQGTAYTVTITGARTLSGTPPPAAITWSFSTGGLCPCTLFSAVATPAVVDSGDGSAVTLGVKLRPTSDGTITGVRFFKAATNTGTHTGSLWDDAGTRLATVTFANETATGWQQASFATPVTVTAGRTYTVGYFAPTGHYSYTTNFFTDDYSVGPLTAPAGDNGVYLYSVDGFPTGSYGSANYWVDAVFTGGSAPPPPPPAPSDTTAPVISARSATPGTDSATVRWTTDEAATSKVSYGTSASDLTSTATSPGLGTDHSVALGGLTQGTVYYYRVVSVDASGNSATSPASADAAGSFAVADSSPPVVSNAAVSGTNSRGNATWSTNEPSTSVVSYGTSPTALNSTASSPGLVTSHSVPLTGLLTGGTYYYRVTSVDAAGNSATAPAAADPAAGFTVVDTIAPTVSAVTATAKGITATVTWTTDEVSSSSVDFGTSASSLTSNATSAAGTSHAVTLTGLTGDTPYFYRVSSADTAGNRSTSPAGTASPGTLRTLPTRVGDTTSTDFARGTTNSSYVADNGDGEVVPTSPSGASEFSATTLPNLLTSTIRSRGSILVANGAATIQNADATSSSTYSPDRSSETRATLAPNQSIGFVGVFSSSVKLSFSVNAANQLVATANDGLTTGAAVVATNWTVAPHGFRIEWTSGRAAFYLDDVAVYSRAFRPLFASMRLVFSDLAVGDAALVVDWMRIGPYAASGSYVSRVFDGTTAVNWGAVTLDASIPSGTGLTVQVRTGNVATPNSTWSGWTTVAANGSVGRKSRYLQYQLLFTTSGSRFVAPVARAVSIGLAFD